MSRDADEKRGVGSSRKPTAKPKQADGGFVTFHPTETEKKAIKALDVSIEGQWEFIGDCIERGLDVKITRNSTDSAFCLVIRERSAGFKEGTALSVFHSNMSTLLALAFYALTVKYPGYPEQPLAVSQMLFDW